MPGLEDAIALAVEAHRGQVDRAGLPYVLHPLRVMLRLDSETERIVAMLHDVVEDTPATSPACGPWAIAPKSSTPWTASPGCPEKATRSSSGGWS